MHILNKDKVKECFDRIYAEITFSQRNIDICKSYLETFNEGDYAYEYNISDTIYKSLAHETISSVCKMFDDFQPNNPRMANRLNFNYLKAVLENILRTSPDWLQQDCIKSSGSTSTNKAVLEEIIESINGVNIQELIKYRHKWLGHMLDESYVAEGTSLHQVEMYISVATHIYKNLELISGFIIPDRQIVHPAGITQMPSYKKMSDYFWGHIKKALDNKEGLNDAAD